MCKWWHNWHFCVNYPFKQPVTSSWCYSPLFFSFYTVWRLRRVSGSFCYESSTGSFALMDDPLSWAETLSVSHKTLRRGAYNEPPLQQAKERKRGKNEKKDEINRQGLEDRETLVWLHHNSHTYTSQFTSKVQYASLKGKYVVLSSSYGLKGHDYIKYGFTCNEDKYKSAFGISVQ